jgi:anti-anti-sigma factor
MLRQRKPTLSNGVPPLASASLDGDSSSHGLNVRVTIGSDSAQLSLSGEMDLSNADLLTAVVAHHLQQGHRELHVDLADLSFLDGSGLGALVNARNQCLAAQGTLTLTAVSPQVRRILDITNLDEVLPVDEVPAS